MMLASELPIFKEVILDHIASCEAAVASAPTGEKDSALKKVLDDFSFKYPG